MGAAIVLGASTGVGAAVADALAYDYGVIGFHRGKHEPTRVRGQLLIGDAGSSEEHVAAAVRMLHGVKVSVLVHSLASASVGNALDMTPKQVERTFNVMAHSFFYWCQELHNAGMLVEDGASLIALSNPCVDFYLRGSGVIGAAKAALESYVRTLAAELGPFGHRVNAIRFSTVMTPALEKVLSPAALAHLATLHESIVPRGRMQTPKDIAGIVARLVQDTTTNGAVLDHTGGAPLMLMDYAFHHGERAR